MGMSNSKHSNWNDFTFLPTVTTLILLYPATHIQPEAFWLWFLRFYSGPCLATPFPRLWQVHRTKGLCLPRACAVPSRPFSGHLRLQNWLPGPTGAISPGPSSWGQGDGLHSGIDSVSPEKWPSTYLKSVWTKRGWWAGFPHSCGWRSLQGGKRRGTDKRRNR